MEIRLDGTLSGYIWFQVATHKREIGERKYENIISGKRVLQDTAKNQ